MKADFQIAAKLLAEAIQFKLAARWPSWLRLRTGIDFEVRFPEVNFTAKL